jgi:HEAT repeat protein
MKIRAGRWAEDPLSSRPVRRLIVGCVLSLAALCGCELNLRPGSESLIQAVSTERTPGELAQMAVNPYDANDRYLGVLGLANETFANQPVYIRLFTDSIKDPEPSVRAAAARGLANHGEPAHVKLLVGALSDADPLVRQEAARGLQRLHDDSAIDPLIRAMREPDVRDTGTAAEREASVRTEAAMALGQYPQRRVVQALIAGLDDSELAVNDASLSSLRVLTGQDFGLDRVAWVDWLGRAKQPFAAQGVYTYPVFHRDPRWFEYVPFVSKPHNEVAAPPAGLPRG